MAIAHNAFEQLTRAEEVPKPVCHRGMTRTLRRVAILGAGTMGVRVAAHFANSGVPSLLLSRVNPKEKNRNATGVKAIQTAVKQKPASFFSDDLVKLVKVGNYDDNFNEIAECDWVIETVAEDLQIKRDIWRRVESVAKPDTILSTCTSGVPLAKIVEGFSEQFRKNFLGTHVFNPPRYLHLMEVIPGPDTDPEVVAFVEEYSERRLGKGVVLCKDTPAFVANRMGAFFGATVTKITLEDDYTIEEADLLTGPLIGLPNTGTFRLLDVVGVDIWTNVSRNLYHAVPGDPWRDRFLPPDFETKMLEHNWIGEKTGQGMYKKVVVGEEKEIWALDWKTLEYHLAQKPTFLSVEVGKSIEDFPERMRALVNADDRAGKFLWKLFSDYFLYAAEMIPEISGRIVEIDRGMKWGYAHKFGPFEMWDALGFQDVVARMKKEGRAIPHNIETMLAKGATSFYNYGANGQPQYFDFDKNGYEPIKTTSGALVIGNAKRSNGVIKKNAGASLVDLGDGALCVELHSKMNSIGEDIIHMLHAGIEETNKNFDAMVIATDGENFSVGANLVPILLAAEEGEWDELNEAVSRFQKANMALKYAAKPVVSALFARTLGGGCEIGLHTIPQASAELYMGQVEMAVGLIPAGGGCKELLIRLKEARPVFELVGYAKVSTSAEEAKKLGFLDRSVRITMNPERLIGDAKTLALTLASDYVPAVPRTDIKVGGEAAYSLLKLGLWGFQQGNFITEHDQVVGERLAYVLAGGRLIGEQLVSEQYLLDLEREAFLSLCGHPATRARMAYMLKTGKPLRN